LSEQDSAKEALKLAAVFIAGGIKPIDGVILLSEVIVAKDFVEVNRFFAMPKKKKALPPSPPQRATAAERLSELTSEPQAA
jgi:hypothetical protein